MWSAHDGPVHYLTYLSIVGSHTLRADRPSPDAVVSARTRYLRFFASADCAVRLVAPDGSTRTCSVPARRAWFTEAGSVARVTLASVVGPGKLYLNELG